jgi:hypothetical protein
LRITKYLPDTSVLATNAFGTFRFYIKDEEHDFLPEFKMLAQEVCGHTSLCMNELSLLLPVLSQKDAKDCDCSNCSSHYTYPNFIFKLANTEGANFLVPTWKTLKLMESQIELN